MYGPATAAPLVFLPGVARARVIPPDPEMGIVGANPPPIPQSLNRPPVPPRAAHVSRSRGSSTTCQGVRIR